MASYHTMHFGMFGGAIPRDMDGYTHTTARDWFFAPMDWGPEYDPDADFESFWRKCEELAGRSREEIAIAERLLARWQIENARGEYVVPAEESGVPA